MSLFSNMSNFMKKPNIIVHLDVSPEESLRRIKLRDRDCESGITLEYLQGLHAAYEEFINDIARVIPVIKVNYSEFRTAEEMAEKIKAEYEQIANIRTVTFQTSSTGGSTGVKSEVEAVAEKLAVEASVSAEAAGGTARETPVDLADNSA